MLLLFAAVAALFLLAYRVYGGFLERRLGLDDSRATPSHTEYDGVDRVPARMMVLLGHHFSSIAGAGPVVGPIIAGVAFGWLPALLWVALGSVFIGGVHDFSSLAASIRHRARSIAEIAKEQMSPLAYRLLLAFIWLTLVYVLVVFTDLTSSTFVADGGVASSSAMFIVLAVMFGQAINRFKMSPLWASLVFVPLVFVAVALGQLWPLDSKIIPAFIAGDPGKTWSVLLLLYCFAASVTPVWVLLQPRDYLSSYLLYASILAGFLGILVGRFDVSYPAFIGWQASELGPLFPILFITIACGACSGFHAIVASGTSSKQLDRERHARPISYGAMLIEGMVAVIALSTVMLLPRGDALAGKPPLVIYGNGIGRFLSLFGLPQRIGFSFGLLALSTFILTTLDTATRLGRYIFEEFFGLGGGSTRFFSTLATLLLPAVFLLITFRDAQGAALPAWKVIWPVFGAANQLLAGLALLVVTVWLKRSGRRPWYTALPMVFMVIMTIWALVILIGRYRLSTVGVIAVVLLILALMLVYEAVKALGSRR